MKPPNEDHRLADILRAGDPAASSEPILSAEAARMRTHVRAAAGETAPRPWMPWSLAAAGIATAALVVIAVPYGLFPADTPTTAPPTAGPGIESSVVTNRREIHFTAPNGTRIIWNLRKDGTRPQKADAPRARS